jgi:hypothetical protein
MYLSGVVIPDLDDDENVVVASSDYEQVYLPQQYGDDGVLAGDEGFGIMQAKALKAKLMRGRGGRRRVGMGRHGFLFVGGSPSGLGVAPAIVAGATSLATGGRVLGISFKKGRPRMFGGPLVDTVNGVRAKVEAGDLSAIQQMDRDRKSAKDKKAWQRIWTEVLPTWRYTTQGYALIKQLDAAFRGPPPAPAATYTPTAPAAPGLPAPAPASPVDATGAPAPVVISQMPSPSPIPGGAAPTASEQVAAASQEEVVGVQQAGFGGLDLKNPMTMMMLAGAGLFVISQLGGSGKRRRRR